MKRLLIYSFALLFITACDPGVEKYRSEIEGLSSDWEEVSTSITTLLEMIQSTKTNWQTKLDQMSLTDETKAKISEDNLSKLDSLKSTYADFGPQVDGMYSQIQKFAGNWGEQQSQLETLTAGLQEGNIEGDIPGKIQQVKENIDAAKEKMDNWQTTFEALEDELDKVANERADLLQAVL